MTKDVRRKKKLKFSWKGRWTEENMSNIWWKLHLLTNAELKKVRFTIEEL